MKTWTRFWFCFKWNARWCVFRHELSESVKWSMEWGEVLGVAIGLLVGVFLTIPITVFRLSWQVIAGALWRGKQTDELRESMDNNHEET